MSRHSHEHEEHIEKITLNKILHYTGKHFVKRMTKIVWSIIWLIILIIFSFWIATFLAFFYIILYPITSCIPDISVVTDFLLKCIQFPKYCADNMMQGTPLF